MDSEVPAQPLRLKVWRRFFSIVIAFHLFAVFVGANRQSYLGVKAAAFLDAYGNLFEVTQAWDFFAPDPGFPMSMEWELMDDTGDQIRLGRWPDPKTPLFPEDRQFRRVCAARFMTVAPERAERMIIPYLCRQDTRVDSIRLWRVIEPLQLNSTFVMGRVPAETRRLEREAIGHYYCDRTGSGGGL